MALLLKAQQNKRKEGGSLRHKGSLTVESAFILPLFFLLITAFICILDLYRICTLVQTSLCEGAKELGMYAYCREEKSSSPGWSRNRCSVYRLWNGKSTGISGT